MNIKLILLSLFTLLYFFGAQWLYSNKVAGVCCGPEKEVDMASIKPGTSAKNLPVAFKWQDANPILGSKFTDYKTNSILNGMTDNNILHITGYYFGAEDAPEGFDNMGMARAAALRDLLKGDIPENRIDISSRLARNTQTMERDTFASSTFNWLKAPEKGETTIVALEDEVTIYFPFNSTVRDQNPQVDEYLKKLSDRLKQTEEKVSITGHTDDVGEDKANLELGMRRAGSIQDILLSLGISKDRITIDSKGERQPATSNETEEGRHRNRRTVLQIMN